jgi:hypothetical protein
MNFNLAMKLLSVLIVMAFLSGFIVGYAEDAKPKYAPSEVQALRLQVRQKDAQLAQRELQMTCTEPQQKFQKAISDLNAEAEKVKKDNGWPKEATFNPDTLAFTEPPPAKPAVPPAPEPKP